MTELVNSKSSKKLFKLNDTLANFSFLLGLLVVGAIFLIVIFGPFLAPYNPYLLDVVVSPHYDFEQEIYIDVPVNPNEEFPLGTNEAGMDMISLILHGARITIIASVLIAASRVIIGLFVGLAAGWFEGGLFDRGAMNLISITTSLPILISAMFLVYVIGLSRGVLTFFVALTVVGWTEIAQYIRGEVLVLRKMPYMEAARAIGLRELQIAIKHVTPNILPQLFVIAFLEVGAVLMLLGELALVGVFVGGSSSLNFSEILTVTIQDIAPIARQPEWGSMIASGFRWLRSNPHLVIVPASAVFTAVFGFNAIGEGLRRIIERQGSLTRFIVSRKMIVSMLLVTVLIFTIFLNTQPIRWFQSMARNFDNSNIESHTSLLSASKEYPIVYDTPPLAALYIREQLNEYGTNGAVKWSNYFRNRTEMLYEPAWIPQLAVLNELGIEVESFDYGSDFAFVMDGYGGSGNETATLTLLQIWPDLDYLITTNLGTESFEGQIVLIEEGNAPLSLGPELVRRGAEGIVWIAKAGEDIRDSRLAPLSTDETDNVDTVPVFRVSFEAAEHILQLSGLRLADAPIVPDPAAAQDVQWKSIDTAIRLRMQLGLNEPIPLSITNIFAYLKPIEAGRYSGFSRFQIIFLVSACDGLWSSEDNALNSTKIDSDECMAPMMIEIARMLDENDIDLRRPILFVIWGGGEFSYSGLSAWLSDESNYFSLAGPVSNMGPTTPVMLQFETGSANGLAVKNYSSDPELLSVFADAADWRGIELNEIESEVELPLWLSPAQTPYQAIFRWDTTGEEAQQIGESISLALVRMLREGILIGSDFP
jgi:peptide/nickel transport system permease protein